MDLNLKDEKRMYFLLASMVSVDIVFMFMHVLYKLGVLSNHQFLITIDHGYAENFQYMKEISIILLFFLAGIKRKKPAYFAWMLLFLYAFIDDFTRIHEKVGSFLKHHFNLPEMFGIGNQNMGELMVTFIAGMLLVSILGIAYYYSDKDEKRISRTIFFLLVILGFFGIVVDIFGSLVKWRVFKGILALVEDGGEMVVMSFILWYILKSKIYIKNTFFIINRF